MHLVQITVAGNYVAQEPDVRSPSNATTPGNETRPGACEFGVDFPPAAGPPIPFAEAMQRLMTLIGSCGKQVDLLGELTAIIGGSPEVGPRSRRRHCRMC